MMTRRLLYNPFSSQKVKIFLVLMFLLSYNLFFLTLFILIIYSLLFKKKKLDRSLTDSLQAEILYAPFSGKVQQINSQKIVLQMPFFWSYGVQMPFHATILNYKINVIKNMKFFKTYSVELVTQGKLGECKFQFQTLFPTILPRIWCRPGDIVSASAYIGYLLFGGKMSIETEKDFKILVDESDKIQRMKTLIGSKG